MNESSGRTFQYVAFISSLFVFSALCCAQEDKRFGEVCAQLTTRSTCRVCQKGTSAGWSCLSDQVFVEVPGSSLNLPADTDTPSLRRRSASDSDANLNRACPDWSDHFDNVLNPALKQQLEQSREQGWLNAIKQGESQGVPLSEQIEQGRKLQQTFETQLPQLQQTVRALSGSDSISANPVECASSSGGSALMAAQCQLLLVKQMIEITKGTTEIMECYLSGPSTIARKEPSRIIGNESLSRLQSRPIDDAVDSILDSGKQDSASSPNGAAGAVDTSQSETSGLPPVFSSATSGDLPEPSARPEGELALTGQLADGIKSVMLDGLPDWAGDAFGSSTGSAIGTLEQVHDLYATASEAATLWNRINGDDAGDSMQAIGDAGALAADHVFSNPLQSLVVSKGSTFIGGMAQNEMTFLDGAFRGAETGSFDAQTQEVYDDPYLLLPGMRSIRDFNTKLEMSVGAFQKLFGFNSN